MSREFALENIRMMQKRGLYKEFEQKPKSLLDKELWFCVVHNTGNRTFSEYKELVKRLHNGEVIFYNGKRMTLVYGFGKFLGKMTIISRDKKWFSQVVLYDTVRFGSKTSDSPEIYHEAWIQLGEWAKKLLMKEKVVFS